MLYRLPLRDSISRECCRGAQHTHSESKRLAAATEETSDVINDKASAKKFSETCVTRGVHIEG